MPDSSVCRRISADRGAVLQKHTAHHDATRILPEQSGSFSQKNVTEDKYKNVTEDKYKNVTEDKFMVFFKRNFWYTEYVKEKEGSIC